MLLNLSSVLSCILSNVGIQHLAQAPFVACKVQWDKIKLYFCQKKKSWSSEVAENNKHIVRINVSRRPQHFLDDSGQTVPSKFFPVWLTWTNAAFFCKDPLVLDGALTLHFCTCHLFSTRQRRALCEFPAAPDTSRRLGL